MMYMNHDVFFCRASHSNQSSHVMFLPATLTHAFIFQCTYFVLGPTSVSAPVCFVRGIVVSLSQDAAAHQPHSQILVCLACLASIFVELACCF